MSSKAIEPFRMKVEEIFRFGDGSTIFVGTVIGGNKTLTPKTRKHTGSMKQLGQKKRQKSQQVGGSGETPSAHAVG